MVRQVTTRLCVEHREDFQKLWSDKLQQDCMLNTERIFRSCGQASYNKIVCWTQRGFSEVVVRQVTTRLCVEHREDFQKLWSDKLQQDCVLNTERIFRSCGQTSYNKIVCWTQRGFSEVVVRQVTTRLHVEHREGFQKLWSDKLQQDCMLNTERVFRSCGQTSYNKIVC